MERDQRCYMMRLNQTVNSVYHATPPSTSVSLTLLLRHGLSYSLLPVFAFALNNFLPSSHGRTFLLFPIVLPIHPQAPATIPSSHTLMS